MDPELAKQLSTEVLEACTLVDGKLTLADEPFLAFGARINASTDKQGWAVSMIALTQRLRDVPGAGLAAERIAALGALALGDRELSTLVARATKPKR